MPPPVPCPPARPQPSCARIRAFAYAPGLSSTEVGLPPPLPYPCRWPLSGTLGTGICAAAHAAAAAAYWVSASRVTVPLVSALAPHVTRSPTEGHAVAPVVTLTVIGCGLLGPPTPPHARPAPRILRQPALWGFAAVATATRPGRLTPLRCPP